MSGKKKTIATVVAVLVIVGLLGAWIGLKIVMQRAIYRAVEKIQRDSGGKVTIKVGDVSANPVLRQATLSDLTIELQGGPGSATTFHVNTLKVVRWKRLGGGSSLLRELTLEWRGVKSAQFDWQLASASPGVKKVLGETLLFDLTHTSVYRPENEHQLDIDVSISSAKLGALVLHLATSGLDVKELEQLARAQQAEATDPRAAAQLRARAQAALAAAVLRDASLSVRNTGGLDAWLASQAASAGTTPDEERKKLKGAVAARCSAPRAEPWMKRVCPALTAVVDDPQSLRLSLTPSAPVPLAQAAAGGIETLVERLNLKLVANEKP